MLGVPRLYEQRMFSHSSTASKQGAPCGQVPSAWVTMGTPIELNPVPSQLTAPLGQPGQTAPQLPMDVSSTKTIDVGSIPDHVPAPAGAPQQAPTEILTIGTPGEAATSGGAVPTGTEPESRGIWDWQLPKGDFAHTMNAPASTAARAAPNLQQQEQVVSSLVQQLEQVTGSLIEQQGKVTASLMQQQEVTRSLIRELEQARGSLMQESEQLRAAATLGASSTLSSEVRPSPQASTAGTAPAETEAGSRGMWDWQLRAGDLSQVTTAPVSTVAKAAPLPQEVLDQLRGSLTQGAAPVGTSLASSTEARPSQEASVSGPAAPAGTGAGSRSIWDWQLPHGALSLPEAESAAPSNCP